MSPALLKKYLEAARHVADHLVLKPEGFAFAPHPVVTDTDRDKYCVRRIIDFYQRQRTDYADYFLAAWRFQHRAALGKPQRDAGRRRRGGQASAPSTWRRSGPSLTESPEEVGPIAALQALWRELPTHDGSSLTTREPAASGCATSSCGCASSSCRRSRT